MRELINSAGGRRFLLVILFMLIVSFNRFLQLDMEILKLLFGAIATGVTGITITDSVSNLKKK